MRHKIFVILSVMILAGCEAGHVVTDSSDKNIEGVENVKFDHNGSGDHITLIADGPGDTYDLIDEQGFGNENPDCEHTSFGEHVTETSDSELGKDVFVFHSHIDADNDRCSNFDRVRMEIKGGAGSPAILQHTEGQTAYYRWKFRLASDFEGTSSFTHLFQVKAYGGSDSGAPVITITPRSSIVEIIHSGGSTGNDEGRLTSTDLSPFLGTWVEGYVRYTSSENGSFEISLKRVSDGQTLLSYSTSSLDLWRDSEFNRPKWGVYRKKASELKDEQVRFADFCVSESSSSACPPDAGGGTLPNIGTGTSQAENLNKSGYETNTFEGETCARATSTSTGYVNGEFSGSSGNYDLTIRYHDENDGQATLQFIVDGSQIGSRTLNVDDHTWKSWNIDDVFIENGDEIRIEGARESGEHARVDYIEITGSGGLSNGTYIITAKHSGRAMVVEGASTADNANIFQYSYGGSDTNDEWIVTDVGNDYYSIINDHSGKSLTIDSGGTERGLNAKQYTYNGWSHQRYRLEDMGGGYYRMRNAQDFCIDVEQAGTSNEDNILQWDCHSNDNQQWSFTKL